MLALECFSTDDNWKYRPVLTRVYKQCRLYHIRLDIIFECFEWMFILSLCYHKVCLLAFSGSFIHNKWPPVINQMWWQLSSLHDNWANLWSEMMEIMQSKYNTILQTNSCRECHCNFFVTLIEGWFGLLLDDWSILHFLCFMIIYSLHLLLLLWQGLIIK